MADQILKVPDPVAREMRGKYEAGMSIPELVIAYNYAKSTVRQALLRVGTILRPRGGGRRTSSTWKADNPPPYKATTPDQDAALRAEYETAHLSVRALAEKHGIPRSTMHKALIRAGTVMRKRDVRDTPSGIVGCELQRLRQQHGWTQGDMRNQLATIGHDVSIQTIGTHERGDQPVSVPRLLAMLDVLGVRPAEFWAGVDALLFPEPERETLL
jgi:DNA-binding XRE family transcriptional regulator